MLLGRVNIGKNYNKLMINSSLDEYLTVVIMYHRKVVLPVPSRMEIEAKQQQKDLIRRVQKQKVHTGCRHSN